LEQIWHALSKQELIRLLQTDPVKGLTASEAAKRLNKWGKNQLPTQKGPTIWQMFLGQFRDVMVMVLLAATVISMVLGEYVDALTIIAIIILNSVLGLYQEYRAERSLERLKELAAPQATIIRNGVSLTIAADTLVPGDIVKMSQGDRVPADLRLLESVGLEVDESALTGESVPVPKDHEALPAAGVLVGDRRNMLYMGTVLTRGRGLGVVVGTGTNSEIGKIARLIGEIQDEPTPLQRRLAQLGALLVKACLVICLLVFFLGVSQGRAWNEMFLTGVSLAVAAIPEGLPAVVTISLALGVQRMIKRKAIIRKLSAVESLGCTTVICSDKTGTLTKNEMTVTKIWLADRRQFFVSGEGYSPVGEIISSDGKVIDPVADPALMRLVEILALCNNAELKSGSRRGMLNRSRQWGIQGDPTEGALLVLAKKIGYDYEKEKRTRRLIKEIPFDSQRKRMSVILKTEGAEPILLSKGAADVLINRAAYYLRGSEVTPLDLSTKLQFLKQTEVLSAQGLRVLAAAYQTSLGLETAADLENDLILVGLVGMVDPPRPEVARAIQEARQARIRTLMITGDHKLTAISVARQIGLSDQAITGEELDTLSDSELSRRLDHLTVFARVAPEHKIRLVRLLKAKGEVVAMTGDGVNDAPAIKEADIGISMGESGTDVAKEASAIILSDDNYATIVAAIEEGRGIFENIRKFIRYLLGCNTGEVLTMLLAAALNLPLPLIAVQILLMNLVTDGLPAIALSLDPVSPRVMQRPPRPLSEGVVNSGLLKTILLQGTLIALGTIGVFIYSLLAGATLTTSRTMAFSTLVIAQLLYVFRCRGIDSRGFLADLVSNPYLTVAVVISLTIHLAVVTTPLFQSIFQVTALLPGEWGIVCSVAFFVSWLQDLVVEMAISLKRNIRKVLGMA